MIIMIMMIIFVIIIIIVIIVSSLCYLTFFKLLFVLVLWEPKNGKRSVGGQAGTFVDLLEADTGVPRDCLPAVMDDRVGWRKRAMKGQLRST